MFNAFNHANFSYPNEVVFNGSAYNPSAGVITQTNGASRQLQFALKLIFCTVVARDVYINGRGTPLELGGVTERQRERGGSSLEPPHLRSLRSRPHSPLPET